MTIRPRTVTRWTALAAAVALGPLAACTGDDGGAASESTAPPSDSGVVAASTTTLDSRPVLELAAADASLSTFVAAVRAAGFEATLTSPGPLTVFVPTNDAFAAALGEMGVTEEQLLADRVALTDLLTRHVVGGRLSRADLVALNGRPLVTVVDTALTVAVVGSDVEVAGATVVGDGIASVNGMLHVVDAVFPPDTGAAPVGEGGVLDVAESRAELAAFSELLVVAGLEDELVGPGPFTVFAPNDDAFAEALTTLGLDYDELLADVELLKTIVQYHVLPQRVTLADLATIDPPDVTTLAGPTVRISLEAGSLKVNDATVVTGNIDAVNGVIHVIDRVLLPSEA